MNLRRFLSTFAFFHKDPVKWYRKAAEQGDADAQHNLGWMYANGKGVIENDKEAVKWYRKAAEQGHTKAQQKLDAMYAYTRFKKVTGIKL